MSLLEAQVEKAVTALLKVHELNKDKPTKDGRTELIQDEETISLIIALKKIPEQRSSWKPRRIPLPHTLNPNPTICLFVKDAVKKRFQEEAPIDGVQKVLPVTKLKKNYHQFDARRKLVRRFDLFFADDRIYEMLPRLVGKEFFRRKKIPVPVDLTVKDVEKEIAKARDSTYLYDFNGSCIAVRIGKTDQSIKDITDNIMVGMKKIAKQIPQKWENIQSINIKTNTSLALPIYNDLPEPALEIHKDKAQAQQIKVTGGFGQKRKKGEVEAATKELAERAKKRQKVKMEKRKEKRLKEKAEKKQAKLAEEKKDEHENGTKKEEKEAKQTVTPTKQKGGKKEEQKEAEPETKPQKGKTAPSPKKTAESPKPQQNPQQKAKPAPKSPKQQQSEAPKPQTPPAQQQKKKGGQSPAAQVKEAAPSKVQTPKKEAQSPQQEKKDNKQQEKVAEEPTTASPVAGGKKKVTTPKKEKASSPAPQTQNKAGQQKTQGNGKTETPKKTGAKQEQSTPKTQPSPRQQQQKKTPSPAGQKKEQKSPAAAQGKKKGK